MYKTVLSRTGNSTAYLGAYSAIWRSTNAINTINLATNPALTFMSGTTIAISEKTELKVPLQGYIRAVGPNFKSTDWGFNVGDRVLISGGGVLAPNYDDSERDRFFMEPHAIKSVLIEDK